MTSGSEARSAAGLPGEPIVRVPRDGPLPLSSSEELIWNYARDPAVSAGYVRLIADRIVGPLDPEALAGSLEDLIARHEILRCTFSVVDGRPQHLVHPVTPLPLPIHEAEPGDAVPPSLVAAAARQIATLTDLTKGPLFKALLFRSPDGRHWLLRVCHQIVWDAWSHALFYQELRRFYEARRAGTPLRESADDFLQYADYAAWQRRQVESGRDESAAIAWWKAVYSGLPPQAGIPFRHDTSAPALERSEGEVDIPVSAQLVEQVEQFRREARTTSHLVWLAAFAALLAAETENSRVVVTGYATTRRGADLQRMIGFFTNTIAYPFNLNRRASFREWQSHVRARVREADANGAVTQEELRQKGVSVPSSGVIFGYIDVREAQVGDLVFFPRAVPRSQTPWGFTLTIRRSEGQTSARATFDAGEYDPARVHPFLVRLNTLLAAVLAEPDTPLDRLLEGLPGLPRRRWWRRWWPLPN